VTDVLTRYQNVDTDGAYILHGDWSFVAPDLETDDGPHTAVLLSLFTDALAHDDDVLPDIDQQGSRRGWWADTDAPEGPLGSRLWLLVREKETEDVRLRAEFYAREALQWMIDDEFADRIDVTATWAERGRLDLHIQIHREERLIFSRPYPLIWQTVRADAV
jgi:phage gp46-like protein